MSRHPALLVALNEISTMLKQPLVIVIICFILILAAINGLVSTYKFSFCDEEIEKGIDPILFVGIRNLFSFSTLLLSILSFSIAILSVAEERSRGSIRVLMTKPLYRRDYIAGKYLGLSLLIVLLVCIVVAINASAIMIFYGGPMSMGELVVRLASYCLILSLYCIEMMGIAMLIGVYFKNLYHILIISATVLCLEEMSSIPLILQNTLGDLLLIRPWKLLCRIISPTNRSFFTLLDTSVPFMAWLGEALPYIVFLLVLVLLLMLMVCYVFNNEES